MSMLITNLTPQEYWFGPLHLAAAPGTLSVDDTTATSLYLSDDTVADAINTLVAAGKISQSGAALPFPRATGAPQVLHGDGSPEGIVYACQSSIYMRRDTAAIYQKNTGIHVNTGWAIAITTNPQVTTSALSGGPPITPQDKDIWIATNVGNGPVQRWQFQYDANETTAYKWKFIGGSGIKTGVGNGQNTLNNTWQNVASRSIPVIRAGHYRIDCGALIETTNSADLMYYGVGTSTGGVFNPYFYIQNGNDAGGADWRSVFGTVDTLGDSSGALAASSTVYLNFNVTNWANTNIDRAWLSLIPIMIS